MQGWDLALSMCRSKDSHWALYAKSVLDRTRLALAHKAEWYQQILQPSAEYLGSQLGVDRWAVSHCLIFNSYILIYMNCFSPELCSYRWKYSRKKLSVLDLLLLCLLFLIDWIQFSERLLILEGETDQVC